MAKGRMIDYLRLVVFVGLVGGTVFFFLGATFDVETAPGTLGELTFPVGAAAVFVPADLPTRGDFFLAAVPGRAPRIRRGEHEILLQRAEYTEDSITLRVAEEPHLPPALGDILELRTVASDSGSSPAGGPPRPGTEDPQTVVMLYPGSGEWTEMTLVEILRHPNGADFVTTFVRIRLQELGPWGPVAYVVLCTLGTIVLFPATIMWIVGAFSFGPILGALWVFLGANGGAVAAFLTGRWIARDTVERFLPRQMRALSDSLERAGFRTILLLRLIPVMPYNGLNYACSISRMRFRDYLVGGAIGMAPMVFLWVQATLAATRIRFDDPITWAPMILLIVLLVVSYVWGRKKLKDKKAPRTG